MQPGRSTTSKVLAVLLLWLGTAYAAEPMEPPTTADRPNYDESAADHAADPPPPLPQTPPLPEGLTLDEVLDRAAGPPPWGLPPSMDEQFYTFTRFDQFEYRLGTGGTRDQLGWEAEGWHGGDYEKLWWKHEGEAAFDGPDAGETETSLLYSRLVSPFWNFQTGLQYANSWGGQYRDRVSAVVGIEGLVPYKIELDAALYLSQYADVTAEVEAEYDVRLTQRLVFQPRLSIGLAAQDVPERGLGAGFTDAVLDFRLRYEIAREIAPYVGFRYHRLLGGTENRAEVAGEPTDRWYFLGGLRFAF